MLWAENYLLDFHLVKELIAICCIGQWHDMVEHESELVVKLCSEHRTAV